MSPDPEFTMGEVARTMQRIETKLDAVTSDHEKRLRSLERWMYLLPPTVLSSLAAVVVTLMSQSSGR